MERGTYRPIFHTVNCPYDLELTEEMVRQHSELLDVFKSPGPDCIHPKLLRMFSNSLARPIYLIFYKSLETGILPSDWKNTYYTYLQEWLTCQRRRSNFQSVAAMAAIAATVPTPLHVLAPNYIPVSLTSVIV